jgi:toxin ParE1/3/4
MNRYIIAPSASKDLNNITDYFFKVNIQAGENFFRKFNKKCQQLTATLKVINTHGQTETKIIVRASEGC